MLIKFHNYFLNERCVVKFHKIDKMFSHIVDEHGGEPHPLASMLPQARDLLCKQILNTTFYKSAQIIYKNNASLEEDQELRLVGMRSTSISIHTHTYVLCEVDIHQLTYYYKILYGFDDEFPSVYISRYAEKEIQTFTPQKYIYHLAAFDYLQQEQTSQ